MATKNLTELRASNPSPGLSDLDLLLQRVVSSNQDVAATAAQLKDYILGSSSAAALLALMYRPWEAGTYTANKLFLHEGRLCLSKKNATSTEPGASSNDDWAIFDKVGDWEEFLVGLIQPYP